MRSLVGHLLAKGSVFAFLAEHRQRLFPAEIFVELFPWGLFEKWTSGTTPLPAAGDHPPEPPVRGVPVVPVKQQLLPDDLPPRP